MHFFSNIVDVQLSKLSPNESIKKFFTVFIYDLFVGLNMRMMGNCTPGHGRKPELYWWHLATQCAAFGNQRGAENSKSVQNVWFFCRNVQGTLFVSVTHRVWLKSYCSSTHITWKTEHVLTVWVVAVHVPFLTFVQPVSIVDDAHLPKSTVGTSFNDGVANAPFVEPSGRTHVETWTCNTSQSLVSLLPAQFGVSGVQFKKFTKFVIDLIWSLYWWMN